MQRDQEPILHVDMDAFFASVEQRDEAGLRGRPVVVGATEGRGVVAAASYEARRFGVHSAMPMVRARRLCPDLVVVPPRFDRYREVSRSVMGILAGYSPLVEPLSLDEAFVDVAGAVRLFGPPETIGVRIRQDVRERLELACSVGVGPNKFVAKLLSGKAKPDGLLHWRAEEVAERLRPLPVGDLWGAGPRTVERLTSYGFRTIGSIADTDLRTLERVVGDALGSQLHALARGVDERAVTPHEPARSVSAETTFDEDVDDPEVLRRVVLRLAEKLGRRLRRAELAARTITLKVRFASFETVTRSRTLPAATDRTHDLVAVATQLLEGLRLERVRVRLVGLGVSNLGDGEAARQLALGSLFEDTGFGDTGFGDVGGLDGNGRWEQLERIADTVAERFEGVGVSYAVLLDDELPLDAPSRDDRPGPFEPPTSTSRE